MAEGVESGDKVFAKVRARLISVSRELVASSQIRPARLLGNGNRLHPNRLPLACLSMNWKLINFICLLLIPAVFSGFAQTMVGGGALQEFEARTAKFKSLIQLPRFEISTNELEASLQQTMTAVNAALDTIAGTDLKKVTLQNTAVALDDVAYQIGLTANRFSVIKETSQNAALRDAATEAVKKLEEW